VLSCWESLEHEVGVVVLQPAGDVEWDVSVGGKAKGLLESVEARTEPRGGEITAA
jgi:hypothetical protein